MLFFLAFILSFLPFVYSIGLLILIFIFYKRGWRESIAKKTAAHSPLSVIIFSGLLYFFFSTLIPEILIVGSSNIIQPIIFSDAVKSSLELGFALLAIIYTIFYIPALFFLGLSPFYLWPIPLSIIKHSYPQYKSKFYLFLRICYAIFLIVICSWLSGLMAKVLLK